MKRLLTVLALTTVPLVPHVGQAQEYAIRGAKAVRDSVYRVQCIGRDLKEPTKETVSEAGTAFAHKSGKVISARHIAENCWNVQKRVDEGDRTMEAFKGFKFALRLMDAEGRTSSAEVTSADPEMDLVLFKPDAGFVRGDRLAIAADDKMKIGAQVSFWGYPTDYKGKMALLGAGQLAGIQADHKFPSINRWVVNGAFKNKRSRARVIGSSPDRAGK